LNQHHWCFLETPSLLVFIEPSLLVFSRNTIVSGVSRFSQKWLDIQNFAKFTAAHFTAKRHALNSFGQHPRFMTIGEDHNKDRANN